jgi:hypothetical protein
MASYPSCSAILTFIFRYFFPTLSRRLGSASDDEVPWSQQDLEAGEHVPPTGWAETEYPSSETLVKSEKAQDDNTDGAEPPPQSFIKRFAVHAYDPAWPMHFQNIHNKLKLYLTDSNVQYTSIEHVGSTAVPGLAAKSNIDIIIEVPDAESADEAKEALTWGPPAEEHYKCIGDGGIAGRISMKLHDRDIIPDQSV